MSIKQKITIYLGLLFMLALILLLWAAFAYKGKTDVGAFIMQLGSLITIIVAAISAVGGFHSGQAGQGGSTLLAPGTPMLGEYVPPASAPASAAAAPAPSPEPAAAAAPQ